LAATPATREVIVVPSCLVPKSAPQPCAMRSAKGVVCSAHFQWLRAYVRRGRCPFDVMSELSITCPIMI